MTFVGCQPLRANTHYRAEECFVYCWDGNATSVSC